MENQTRNRFIIFAFVAAFLLLASGQVLAMGLGAPVINLKMKYSSRGKIGPVVFPHLTHQKVLKCEECHNPGTLNFEIRKQYGMGNDFHEKFCFPCHEKMDVPDGKVCTNCHKSEKKKKTALVK